MNMNRLLSGLVAVVLLSVLIPICGVGADLSPAPIVVQRSPERGEELAIDGVLKLIFDRPMDRASVEAAFSISP
ncbi:hypothetical protein KAW44_01400, partial [Candidatus Bipolaricaulota bacterium]|nr:hypothetical protein [Candidatus Bipolaricaulota bacterium]